MCFLLYRAREYVSECVCVCVHPSSHRRYTVWLCGRLLHWCRSSNTHSFTQLLGLFGKLHKSRTDSIYLQKNQSEFGGFFFTFVNLSTEDAICIRFWFQFANFQTIFFIEIENKSKFFRKNFQWYLRLLMRRTNCVCHKTFQNPSCHDIY